MEEKLRLNDEQWKKLLSLAEENRLATSGHPRIRCGRLRSHGLVSQDDAGKEYLTEKGMHRLNQGR